MAQVRLDVEVPEELLQLLGRSKLSAVGRAEQILLALAIHLFLTGDVSIGKAAELSDRPRAEFEELLVALGLPVVLYDSEELERDRAAIEHLLKRQQNA